MSHRATQWLASIEPERLSHGEFRVLFHLCDCHNPSAGCFPKQSYLLANTGLSNGGLNKALQGLERSGLIRRQAGRKERGGQFRATVYVLEFEPDFAPAPSPLSGDGGPGAPSPLSGDGGPASPSPLSGDDLLHSVEMANKEPVNRTGNDCAVGALKGKKFDKFVDHFLDVYPRKSGDRPALIVELRLALDDGISPERILDGAKAYAHEQAGNAPRFLAFPQNWVKARRWNDHPDLSSPSPTSPEAVMRSWAALVRDERDWVAPHITDSMASEMVRRELVTEEQLAKIGIRL